MKSGLTYTRTVLMTLQILPSDFRMFQGNDNIITKVTHDQEVLELQLQNEKKY